MKKETYEKAKELQERLDCEEKVLNYVGYIDQHGELLIISCGAGSEQLMLPNKLRRQVIDYIKDAISSNKEEINKEFEKL